MTPETPKNELPILPLPNTQGMEGDVGAALERQVSMPYWRSLEQLADTPEFRAGLERQPALGAAEALHASRRRFLQTMGASLGLAGLTATGCIRLPEEKLEPYAHRPENRAPGAPVSYATAFELGGVAQGLLVTSFDGRPIKIEGNPSHPLNAGTADTAAQASVLEVYDPDRTRGAFTRTPGKSEENTSSWDDFIKEFVKKIPADGAGFCILSEPSSSPSLAAMREKLLKKFPKAEWFDYEPFNDDNIREGTKTSLGQDVLPVFDLKDAKVIVSLDADLFGDGSPMAIKYARDFAAGRKLYDKDKAKEMNRLYVIESLHTITGACADHRIPCRASGIGDVTAMLASALDVAGVEAPKEAKLPLLAEIATDLKDNVGHCVVVAGSRQPPEVHALVAAINSKLQNNGKTVVYYPDSRAKQPKYVEGIADLAKKMKSGAVDALLILGGNPVYDAPADVDFAGGMKKVKASAHLSLHDDETSQLCNWQLSRSHYLESWGDARTFDGTASIVQPLIEPLFDGRSSIEVLSILVDEKPERGLEIVRDTVKSLVKGPFTDYRWKKILADGVIEKSSTEPAKIEKTSDKMPVKAAGAPGKGEYELVFYRDKIHGGRYSNNGWLQELPDPMTRLTWDNAALMSEKTAKAINAEQDELIELSAGDVKIKAPVFFLHGMPEGVIGLALGYGRTAERLQLGKGTGQNAYPLRTTTDSGWRMVKARPTGEKYRLATVQDHHIIDYYGKKAVEQRVPYLVRELPLAEAFNETKDKPYKSVFDEHKFNGTSPATPNQGNVPAHDLHKWGMAIDLSSCTGCGACVTACQAENNIPIVGKEQVLHGREMHWIRVDRYFRGEPDEAVAVHQPVTCMHCENAPCESVCPVAATTHSAEGLNMMTYNRCVGTRYCSNNCPYKVRRFNFFDYNRGNVGNEYVPNLLRQPVTELIKMQKNPDVTVRGRGVMEKCTYCIQRIENVRIAAKREGDRPIKDGEIQTACQQTCPAQAIVFGDLNQDGKDGRPMSRVYELQQLGRTYAMMDSALNTKPRTQYVSRIRNTAEEATKTEKS
jgi:molybdopterin-containing oxidoreductase family iron-sulfur binding subunit